MNELEKIAKETANTLGLEFSFYPEKSRPTGVPVCQKPFEGVTDDGSYTFFRFTFKGTGYIGAIEGATAVERKYALLLPAYIESFIDRESDLSKTEGCPLARVMRRELKARGITHLKVVWSSEPVAPRPADAPAVESDGKRIPPASISFVPSSAGLMLAGEIVKDLIQK